MKLTKREITLLFVLAAVFIAFIGVRFFLLPEYQLYKEKLLTTTELTAQLDSAQTDNGQKDTTADQLTVEKENYTELSKPFESSIEQEQVVYWLSGLLKSNNLTVYSTEFTNDSSTVVGFDAERTVPVQDQTQLPIQNAVNSIIGAVEETAETTQETAASSVGEVYCTQIILNATGSYQDIVKFMDELYASDRSVIVDSLSIGDYEKGGKMAVAVIRFIGVPLLDDSRIQIVQLPEPEGKDMLMAENAAPVPTPSASDEPVKDE